MSFLETQYTYFVFTSDLDESDKKYLTIPSLCPDVS